MSTMTAVVQACSGSSGHVGRKNSVGGAAR
jgi:hypothetical protein